MATSWIFIGLKVKKDTDCFACELEHYGPLDLQDELKVSYQKYVTGSTQDLLILIARKMSRR